MTNINIVFTSPEEMTKFINIMNNLDMDVDIKNGSIDFDAKSAEGIYSLPLNRKLTCVVHDSQKDEFATAMSEFIR